MSKAVSNYSDAYSSGGFVTGVFDTILALEEYTENFQKHLQEAINKAIPVYEQRLQERAGDRGWGEASKSISVSYDAKNMEFELAGDLYKEYGTGSEPPRPVLRNALVSTQDLEDEINKEIQEQLL